MCWVFLSGTVRVLESLLRGSDSSNFTSKNSQRNLASTLQSDRLPGRILKVDVNFSRLTRSANHSGQTLLSISNTRGTTVQQERSRCPPLAKANPIRRVSSSILQQKHHVGYDQKQGALDPAGRGSSRRMGNIKYSSGILASGELLYCLLRYGRVSCFRSLF